MEDCPNNAITIEVKASKAIHSLLALPAQQMHSISHEQMTLQQWNTVEWQMAKKHFLLLI